MEAQPGVVAGSGEEGRPQGVFGGGVAFHQRQQFHLVVVVEAAQLIQAGLLLDLQPGGGASLAGRLLQRTADGQGELGRRRLRRGGDDVRR
ncbi:hypothetical protein BIV25_20030 [Streptomyces sp. MUSC 14]|uniref:hypothetical protein n=1 Tax=Streptomyces sp. MUSC 14 TaxID=1354889 RepID=UPI0008F56D4A|nr:hypothetical protein [Streptomyces sp. MUSC 14]OIJ95739.1 hypothetical protein BIV25_20030 [Streptomyces sp. MUSC 14]